MQKIVKTVKNVLIGHSEAAMFIRAAGKTADVEIISVGRSLMGQIVMGGKPYSAPLLLGETGIIYDNDRMEISYKSADNSFHQEPLLG